MNAELLWRHSRLAAGALLVLAMLIVFGRTLGHGFVDWDDPANVVDNPLFQPVTVAGVLAFWHHPQEHDLCPLSHTFWALCVRLSGGSAGPDMSALPFHLANLVLHGAAALLVFALLRRLTAIQPDGDADGPADLFPALAGAMLFAIHPLQVEPVSWVTGGKDVLCGALGLAALYTYHRWTLGPRGRLGPPTLATLLFVLAMLAKPIAVAVPLLALLLARLGPPAGASASTGAGRRPRAALWLPLTWLVLAAPWMWLTKQSQSDAYLLDVSAWWTRPLLAGDALLFYLVKLVAPFGLGPDYGRTPAWVLGHGWACIAWLVPCGLGLWLAFGGRRVRELRLPAALFLAPLLPVLGLTAFAFQTYSTVADRYMYTAMLGPALALASLARRVQGNRLGRGMLLALLLSWAALSVRQAGVWRDTPTLLTHTLRVNPRSFLARNGLAVLLTGQGRHEEAAAHFSAAADLAPRSPTVQFNLGLALDRLGRRADAMRHYSAALDLRWEFADAHNSLAAAHAEAGDNEQAAFHYSEAIRIAPWNAYSHCGLGQIRLRVGDLAAARAHFAEALRLDPHMDQARRGLAEAARPAGP